MTREQQINEWLEANPVVRLSVNGEIVEISGEARVPHFESLYDDGIKTHLAENQIRARSAGRTALRQQWEALPSYIRGPYRDKFEAANRLLDEGDDEAAVALIEYAPAAPDFTAEQIAVFNSTKASMKAGIEALP